MNDHQAGALRQEAVEDHPVAWRITMSDGRYTFHAHNAIGDYRQIDPAATSTPLVAAAELDRLREKLAAMITLYVDGSNAADEEIASLRAQVENPRATPFGHEAEKLADDYLDLNRECATLRAERDAAKQLAADRLEQMQADRKQALVWRDQADAARVEAERLNWLRDKLFEHKWNGVLGRDCAVQWHVVGHFRHVQAPLVDTSGAVAGDFRQAIDAAINATKGAK